MTNWLKTLFRKAPSETQPPTVEPIGPYRFPAKTTKVRDKVETASKSTLFPTPERPPEQPVVEVTQGGTESDDYKWLPADAFERKGGTVIPTEPPPPVLEPEPVKSPYSDVVFCVSGSMASITGYCHRLWTTGRF